MTRTVEIFVDIYWETRNWSNPFHELADSYEMSHVTPMSSFILIGNTHPCGQVAGLELVYKGRCNYTHHIALRISLLHP